MILINRRERNAILSRYPRAEIVSTKHRFYIIGNSLSEPFRYLAEMRGELSRASRKERAKMRNGYALR